MICTLSSKHLCISVGPGMVAKSVGLPIGNKVDL